MGDNGDDDGDDDNDGNNGDDDDDDDDVDVDAPALHVPAGYAVACSQYESHHQHQGPQTTVHPNLKKNHCTFFKVCHKSHI